MKTKAASVSETMVPHYRAAGFCLSENKNFKVTFVKTCLLFTEVRLLVFFNLEEKNN
jgi:hypothetical protein